MPAADTTQLYSSFGTPPVQVEEKQEQLEKEHAVSAEAVLTDYLIVGKAHDVHGVHGLLEVLLVLLSRNGNVTV